MRREWFWKIEQLRQGPDYYFCATFEPTDAVNLAAIVRQNLPASFVHNETFVDAHDQQKHVIYDAYLDKRAYDKLVAMEKGGEPQNIWFLGSIKVRDHELFVSHMLAGVEYGETDLIVAIAQSPNLTLRKWRVSYGGDGYASGEAASGASTTELLEYLGGVDQAS
ncbi:MAG: hypothetical protein AAF152_13715 [Cyanobacteria bacterium P01_A01_bin.114]